MGAPSPKKQQKVKDIIAGARRPERTVLVCLRADLQDAYGDLERQLMQIEREGAPSLAGNPRARALAEEQEAVREQMLEHTLKIRLRGLPRREYNALVAQYPPRDGNPGDKAMGFNVDDAVEALIRTCTVDPLLDEDDWTNLLDGMTDATYELLTEAAWAVNKRDVSVPFSRAGSQILRTSEAG